MKMDKCRICGTLILMSRDIFVFGDSLWCGWQRQRPDPLPQYPPTNVKRKVVDDWKNLHRREIRFAKSNLHVKRSWWGTDEDL